MIRTFKRMRIRVAAIPPMLAPFSTAASPLRFEFKKAAVGHLRTPSDDSRWLELSPARAPPLGRYVLRGPRRGAIAVSARGISGFRVRKSTRLL